MKKGLFNRRIPTVIALLILVAIIGISTYLIQKGIFYIGKAAPDTQPQNFSITNITDSSFTVIFTTSGPVDSVIAMSDAKTGSSIIFDDRDKQAGAHNKYYSHHITVPNLSPNTSYIFKLIVDGKDYLSSAYAVKTGSPITSSPPTQNPIFGKVLLPDGTTGTDAIVIAHTNTSQSISAITDSKGEFIIPTNSMRDVQGSSYVVLQNNSQITISVVRQLMKASVHATFLVAQNLPAITLQQQYVFTPNNEQQSTQSSQLSVILPKASGKTVDITSPKQGESYVDLRPLFTGTSYPNSNVNLSIPGLVEEQIITNIDGTWSYRAINNLPQGKHTVTIITSDSSGTPTTITRTFNIFSQGSQITESATPSASSPTPTRRPTTAPSPTPTVKVTNTPTSPPSPTLSQTTPSPTALPTIIPTVSPTIIPTSTPTPTVLPTIFSTPTKLPPIANPGGTQNTIVLTTFSIILIVAGTSLLFIL